jgi:hypothetical protein
MMYVAVAAAPAAAAVGVMTAFMLLSRQESIADVLTIGKPVHCNDSSVDMFNSRISTWV